MKIFNSLMFVLLASLCLYCDDDDDEKDAGTGDLDTDTDTDSDTDTDTDSDTDADSDTDTDGDTDSESSSESDTEEVITDPCPDCDQPGEYAVEGGPKIELPETYNFQIDIDGETKFQFASSATNPVTGQEGDGVWYLRQEGRGLNGGVIPTAEAGTFDLIIPLFCGVQVFKTCWPNAVGQYCLVHNINNINCIDADIRVTLSWGAGANDLELHLIRDEGQLNNHDGGNSDCTWTNMTPDWGVVDDTTDNPRKDVDWTSDNGIENIFLPGPEDIVYHVMVEYWAAGNAIAPNLVFNVDGQTTVTGIQNFMPKQVWYVGTINWPTRAVTLINTTTDCSTSWSGGCTMDLP